MCLQISPRKLSLMAARVIGKNFSGFIGWLMWGLIPIMILLGFRTKLTVVFDWFLNCMISETMIN